MPDYRDTYTVDVRGKGEIDSLARSTTALAKAGDQAASGGLRNYSGAILQATRASQDFAAAGMLGISNNIIEVGARLGPFGVLAGSVLTAAALNADKLGNAFERLASRPAVQNFAEPFVKAGQVIIGVFKEIGDGIEWLFDTVLGEDQEKKLKTFEQLETGVRKVDAQIQRNKKSQEELTKAESLDADQIRELIKLRDEEIGLMEYKAKLQEQERIKREYGERASDEQIKSGEAFRAATKGDAGKRLFDALSRRMSENDAARVIQALEQGRVGSETLWAALGKGGGGVADVIRDFELRIKGTNLKEFQQGKDALDKAMIALRAGPFLRGGVGGVPPGKDAGPQDWNLGVPRKPEPILDLPEWNKQDFAAQAGMAPPPQQQVGPLGQFGGVTPEIDARADQVFPKNPKGEDKARQDQLRGIREKLNKAQVNLDDKDRAALAELEVTVDRLIQATNNKAQQQQALIGYAQAVFNAINGGEVQDGRIWAEIGRMRDRLRQRGGGPGFGVMGGFGGGM